MDAVELREAGLLVRPWRAEDADEVFRACQDPAIQRWTNVPSPYERGHAVRFVTHGAPRAWADGTGAPFGVFDAATGELLGACGLVTLDIGQGTGEIGYWTAPWARGRGVAVTAGRAVLRWAQAALGLRRIRWQAQVGNHASRLVAARLGVSFEGIARAGLRVGGDWHDAWTGALLSGELREEGDDDPLLALAATRCRVFGQPQPTLTAATGAGAWVRLRPLRPEDVPGCVAAASDPESARYTGVPQPYQSSHGELFVTQFAPRCWAEGIAGIFAIADADDAFVGTMDLRLTGDALTTDTADVGYLVGPWARGRGYATTALRAVCDWGFAELGLRRVQWRAFVGNVGSRATALRAGFTLEGTARQALAHRGVFADTWLAARLRED